MLVRLISMDEMIVVGWWWGYNNFNSIRFDHFFPIFGFASFAHTACTRKKISVFFFFVWKQIYLAIHHYDLIINGWSLHSIQNTFPWILSFFYSFTVAHLNRIDWEIAAVSKPKKIIIIQKKLLIEFIHY